MHEWTQFKFWKARITLAKKYSLNLNALDDFYEKKPDGMKTFYPWSLNI